MYAVVGAEEQRTMDIRQIAGTGAADGPDVLDQRGSGGSAVALPKLRVVVGPLSTEVQRAADVGQIARIGAVRAGQDVAHQHGSGGRTVAFPKLVAMSDVLGTKEQGAADIGQMEGS